MGAGVVAKDGIIASVISTSSNIGSVVECFFSLKFPRQVGTEVAQPKYARTKTLHDFGIIFRRPMELGKARYLDTQAEEINGDE
jgi:hypothetical protein